jgi:hypothetical protein
MVDFPAFMKHAGNRITKSNQGTPGVEGYVFDEQTGAKWRFEPAVKPRYPQHAPTITTNP